MSKGGDPTPYRKAYECFITGDDRNDSNGSTETGIAINTCNKEKSVLLHDVMNFTCNKLLTRERNEITSPE